MKKKKKHYIIEVGVMVQLVTLKDVEANNDEEAKQLAEKIAIKEFHKTPMYMENWDWHEVVDNANYIDIIDKEK